MKKILLPTDFSDTSQNAITYALKMFSGEQCVFYLLSIYKAWEYTTDNLMQASSKDSIYTSLISETKEKLEELVVKLDEDYKDEDYIFKTITDYDVFTDAINQVIELKHISLIIMGTDGATGAKEMIFGSHTLRVIRNVDCPLMVIPKDYEFNGIRNVLYALDYKDNFNALGLQPLKDLLGGKNVFIKVLRMKDDPVLTPEENLENTRIEEFFEDQPVSFHDIQDVPISQAVCSIIQIMKIDLTVMFTHRRLFLERLLFGSNISLIIDKSKTPFLIMRNFE